MCGVPHVWLHNKEYNVIVYTQKRAYTLSSDLINTV